MTPELQRVNTLGVYLHGRRVGVITRLTGDQHLFAFEQDYADDPNRPTLSLAYKARSGGLVTRARPMRRRLPPYFANLLPEGHLRTYLAARAGVHEDREFALMAVLGADLSGAVVVQPEVDPDQPVPTVAADRANPGALHFSLAGAQLKFSVIQETAGGFTIPAQGIGGDWIVKLPSAQFEAVPENEYVMLALARAIGIPVPATRLVPVASIGGLPLDAARTPGSALAVQRFDRAPGGRRIHMEDFAQVFGQFPEDKHHHRGYADIAAVLWAETAGDDVYDFVRRLVFSLLIGNGDMHLKNWAVLYPDGRTPTLAPAYDYVSTVPYLQQDQLALTFGGDRTLDALSTDRIRRFAEAAGLPVKGVWDTAQETVAHTTRAWKSLMEKDLLPPPLRLTIGAQIRKAAAAALKS